MVLEELGVGGGCARVVSVGESVQVSSSEGRTLKSIRKLQEAIASIWCDSGAAAEDPQASFLSPSRRFRCACCRVTNVVRPALMFYPPMMLRAVSLNSGSICSGAVAHLLMRVEAKNT